MSTADNILLKNNCSNLITIFVLLGLFIDNSWVHSIKYKDSGLGKPSNEKTEKVLFSKLREEGGILLITFFFT